MNFSQSISFIHTQAIMKLKSQANTLVLSYLWLIIEPLLYVLLFYFVFKYVLYRGGDDFFIFLVVGKIPFLWFSKSISSGAASITENRGLILQRRIPKWLFPLINCQESIYKQCIAFAVMFMALFFSGYEVTLGWWQLLPLILINYLLIVGVAMLLCVFVTYAPDFKMAIQFLTMGLMFTSGIFWDVNMIQDPAMKDLLLLLNPLAALIDSYRQILMYGGELPVRYMSSVLGWAALCCILGSAALHYYSNGLTRKLLS